MVYAGRSGVPAHTREGNGRLFFSRPMKVASTVQRVRNRLSDGLSDHCETFIILRRKIIRSYDKNDNPKARDVTIGNLSNNE